MPFATTITCKPPSPTDNLGLTYANESKATLDAKETPETAMLLQLTITRVWSWQLQHGRERDPSFGEVSWSIILHHDAGG